ncbi:hypothetical protein LAG90_15770 [Marinilongibacter aquaticus]|uniref:hypothetical protein n=1 Tax=Marinilongibacter aquaticus TaxID=2975157 RepID=UPI0021BD95DC|nr:hypothetical protein [Marinilongibacter aquaticus]UBM58262.1 hypothetical protein LAG90_15770 [Marinilongibacter aquaticus]
MKTTIQFNGNNVEIRLTKEQVAEIKRNMHDYRAIETVEDAFSFLGVDYEKWLETRAGLESHELAYSKLTMVTKAVNGGEWMDYGNSNVYKHYPFFNSSGSGSGFSFNDFSCVRSISYVGSRLCLSSEEKAKYVGNQFLALYNQLIN